MTANLIDRRKVLAVVAAAPAAVALSAPALAQAGEDAELHSLWEEWKAQHARIGDAWKVAQEIEGKVWKEAGPVWTLAKLDTTGKSGYRALFVSSWTGDDRVKAVSIKARDFQSASNRADEARRTLLKEREDRSKAAKRRLGFTKATRAHDQAPIGTPKSRILHRVGELGSEITQCRIEWLQAKDWLLGRAQ